MGKLAVSTKNYKHCDLIEVEGRIDGSTAPDLAQALDVLTNDGRFKIVLDMSQVSFISSAGLRVLVEIQKRCKHLNRGELVLSAVPQRIYEALDLGGFIPLFQFFDDTLDAVGSF
ncbi:MAG: STAS domain-containing protein [Anaerolineae bacterium]|nr:STAS domain-containing protein [Anaerolineae bacterium]